MFLLRIAVSALAIASVSAESTCTDKDADCALYDLSFCNEASLYSFYMFEFCQSTCDVCPNAVAEQGFSTSTGAPDDRVNGGDASSGKGKGKGGKGDDDASDRVDGTDKGGKGDKGDKDDSPDDRVDGSDSGKKSSKKKKGGKLSIEMPAFTKGGGKNKTFSATILGLGVCTLMVGIAAVMYRSHMNRQGYSSLASENQLDESESSKIVFV